jgi:hypothetical protein
VLSKTIFMRKFPSTKAFQYTMTGHEMCVWLCWLLLQKLPKKGGTR